MKQLSKSVFIMFLFDLSVFSVSTLYWYSCFHLPVYLRELITVLILTTGMFSLYLKANYKIREFNITGKNTYLLFEGVIFAHIPALILFLFAGRIKTFLFLVLNIITVFIILRLYRALFHIYLFKLKKSKNILILGTGKDAKLIADEINNKQRQIFINKILKRFGNNLSGKTFAVWGLTFKPKTNDMRMSPAITIINALLEYGANVKAYDPKGFEQAKVIFQDRITFAKSSYDALDGSDCLLLLTEWNEFRRPDFEKVKDLLKSPIIFDGRNQYDGERLIQRGFEYYRVGKVFKVVDKECCSV